MSDAARDVTEVYRVAEKAAEQFNPGQQVDIVRLMRSAFMHGYAQALLDRQQDQPSGE